MSATLAACIWSMIALTISVSVSGPSRRPYLLPLVLVLVALGVLASPPLAMWYSESAYYFTQLLGLVALIAVSPCFWLYVCALTERQRWQFRRKHLYHFTPVIIALAIAAAWLTLPAAARRAMLINGDLAEGAFAMATALLTWLMIVFWMGQSAVYLILSIMRLRRYRGWLRQHFADLESRRLTWLGGVIALLIVIWVWFLVAGFASNILGKDVAERSAANGLLLVTVWLLSLWGIVQRPGFSGYKIVGGDNESNTVRVAEMPSVKGAMPAESSRRATNVPPQEIQPEDPQSVNQKEVADPPKYQRSALSPTQAARIAEHISQHMQLSKMYLQSDLTLAQLAEAIHVVPHYVSQTLNDTMGTTFFDYISRLRVEHAKALLTSTDTRVTDITYEAGFNARSSFYKAFKLVTGTTPSQYRKQHQSVN